jgi:sortase A
VLSAHNDIYGEIFRYLDDLEAGDEIILQTVGKEYVYRVAHWRVVPPTEVNVMEQTSDPIATLISCYPYLVDSQRIVVVAELER